MTKQFRIVILMVCSLMSFFQIFSMEQAIPEQINQIIEQLRDRVREVADIANESVHRSNNAGALAYHANEASLSALRRSQESQEASTRAHEHAHNAMQAIDQIRDIPTQIDQHKSACMADLEQLYNRLRADLTTVTRQQNEVKRDNKIQIQAAKINEKHRLGIFQQEQRIQAQAAVDVETTRWDKIGAMIDNPKYTVKIVLATTALALGFYAIKYGIPILIDYVKRPGVVSETSKAGWFGWNCSQEDISLSDLIFAPALHNKLFDLVLRVQSAKMYNENLPNVLFYGPSGTGKTMFAKALAYYSGLKYALTSGSEFAKITDLNDANNELRKLLDWAQDDDNGLIVFIDEAESLFLNRKLVTTSKSTQDFVNTFIALVPEKSQKNLMFVFATNHPFKLDDAINDRIGINVEFTLPDTPEREKILATYLLKFSQENPEAIVHMHPEVVENLPLYASALENLCPRAIKFIAEEMIVNARRHVDCLLSHDIAQAAIDQAKQRASETMQWAKEREAWAGMVPV